MKLATTAGNVNDPDLTTTDVMQVLVMETELSVRNLTQDEAMGVTTTTFDNNSREDDANDDPMSSTAKGASTTEETVNRTTVGLDAFDDIFASSHTVIIPDSMFSAKSQVFHSEPFLQHGLQALLQHVYNDPNGTIIVLCVEGFHIGDSLNEAFGTHWKLHIFGPCTIDPTPRGLALMGNYCPTKVELSGSPFLVELPNNDPDPDEGLYQVVADSREEFEKDFKDQDAVFERLGIEKDETLTCFDMEKSWQLYVEKHANKYAIVQHEHTKDDGSKGGRVVWFGDREQSERGLSYVFCKLLNMNAIKRRERKEQDPQRYLDNESLHKGHVPMERQESFVDTLSPRGWMVLAVMSAILIKLLMLVFTGYHKETYA